MKLKNTRFSYTSNEFNYKANLPVLVWIQRFLPEKTVICVVEPVSYDVAACCVFGRPVVQHRRVPDEDSLHTLVLTLRTPRVV